MVSFCFGRETSLNLWFLLVHKRAAIKVKYSLLDTIIKRLSQLEQMATLDFGMHKLLTKASLMKNSTFILSQRDKYILKLKISNLHTSIGLTYKMTTGSFKMPLDHCGNIIQKTTKEI
jgi:hypothetical protein